MLARDQMKILWVLGLIYFRKGTSCIELNVTLSDLTF